MCLRSKWSFLAIQSVLVQLIINEYSRVTSWNESKFNSRLMSRGYHMHRPYCKPHKTKQIAQTRCWNWKRNKKRGAKRQSSTTQSRLWTLEEIWYSKAHACSQVQTQQQCARVWTIIWSCEIGTREVLDILSHYSQYF